MLKFKFYQLILILFLKRFKLFIKEMRSKGLRYGDGVKNMIDENKRLMYNLNKEKISLDKNRTEHF